MINCQNPKMGYALYFCEHCNKFMHVPFTCKSRFCNCCGIKYQKGRSDAISAKLINCNHRHIVFTIPEELRIFFRLNEPLLNLLFTAASRTVLDWFYSLNKSQNFKPGIIIALHTFGRDLKWNPHITEGASGNCVLWRNFNYFPYIILRKKWQTTLLFLLEKYLGKSYFRKFKNIIYSNTADGFYVYAKPNLSSKYDVVNYIISYIGRPSMAQSRIIDYDGKFITFWYQRHEDNKKGIETIPIFEFIQRLIIHIPDKNFKMLCYYDIYAKKAIHHSKLIKLLSDNAVKIRKRLAHWRECIELSFGYDPCICSCGHKMTFIELCGIKPLAHSPP